MSALPREIFKAYDIRGIVGRTLTPDIVRLVGRALGTLALAQGRDTFAIGRDGRLSGPELAGALAEGIRANDGCLPCEADDNVNDASRALIDTALREHGSAWLGIVNRSGDHCQPWIWAWDGHPVENFGAAFVLPAHDAELERLLQERHAAPYTGVAEDARLVEGIMSRISAVGGFSLVWT